MPEWSKRDKAKARKTVRAIMQGTRGDSRNAQSKLAAARLILGVDEEHPDDPRVSEAADALLIAEVSKRGLSLPSVDLDAAERAMEVERDASGS